ncbi:MAG: rhodanese-related sulfurtransferase [Saprospiraceae bacterium]|nr:rhodanese-related sulfurtransferase [Saprospiraceae bacterium]
MKKLYNKISSDLLKQQMLESEEKRTTLSFYKYAHIRNIKVFRDHFYSILDEIGVKGRIYVASEGVNGQISVPEENFHLLNEALNSIEFLKGIRLNIAIEDDGKSFYKLKIKIRKKIVADGLNDETFDVTKRGKHISAEEFNQLAEDPETVIVDMRNHYESEVGHFDGAITPDVETFRESLPIIEEMLEPHKDKNIVMYCTGGIRCEKASAYYKHRGFSKVHQLDGGIIEYARQVEQNGLENKFLGKNFVFDERMGERISGDIIAHCHQCGAPCDDHVNCANDACHILFIQCKECADKYHNCCSSRCKEFHELPEETRNRLKPMVEFNGTKFGKGRYKAHRKDEHLEYLELPDQMLSEKEKELL